MTSLSVGSLLDDNAWHDIEIRRDHNNVTLLVDRVRIDDVIQGDFPRLDLNRQVCRLSGASCPQMCFVVLMLSTQGHIEC